jgi:hypothetical protein
MGLTLPPFGAHEAPEVLKPSHTISCARTLGKVYIADSCLFMKSRSINVRASLPSFGRGLRQRSAANRRPIYRVHGGREFLLDLLDGLPLSE